MARSSTASGPYPKRRPAPRCQVQTSPTAPHWASSAAVQAGRLAPRDSPARPQGCGPRTCTRPACGTAAGRQTCDERPPCTCEGSPSTSSPFPSSLASGCHGLHGQMRVPRPRTAGPAPRRNTSAPSSRWCAGCRTGTCRRPQRARGTFWPSRGQRCACGSRGRPGPPHARSPARPARPSDSCAAYAQAPTCYSSRPRPAPTPQPRSARPTASRAP
mmetsp:Transcript_13633/g.47099  ORF Transcript_13633/g.47099 Transcript_13633/m.47099 type:complete len:216 (+) Transcript_13633:1500-2147(+)